MNIPHQPPRPASAPASASPDASPALSRGSQIRENFPLRNSQGVGRQPCQREGRNWSWLRSLLSPIHSPVPSALACPTVPTAGLDTGKKSPVCDRLPRLTAPAQSPPAAFMASRELLIWRPGLGIRELVSLFWPLSCTLSMSYTNFQCMSCKMEGGRSK